MKFNKIAILIVIVIFNGCSWFKYYDRSQECEELLERSEQQIKTAVHLIDSLQTRIEVLENANDR